MARIDLGKLPRKAHASRIYKDESDEIGFDMGEHAADSWLRASRWPNGVHIDSSNMDGALVLSPDHSRRLATTLKEWADEATKPKKKKKTGHLAPFFKAAFGNRPYAYPKPKNGKKQGKR